MREELMGEELMREKLMREAIALEPGYVLMCDPYSVPDLIAAYHQVHCYHDPKTLTEEKTFLFYALLDYENIKVELPSKELVRLNKATLTDNFSDCPNLLFVIFIEIQKRLLALSNVENDKKK